MGSILFGNRIQDTTCVLYMLCHTTFHLGHACRNQSSWWLCLFQNLNCSGRTLIFFFEPLIEDLLDLCKTFSLCVAGLWCIPDYPALSTFLGRTTKGYFACFHCDKHPLSYRLRSKIRYFGNFWFLPKGHCLRKKQWVCWTSWKQWPTKEIHYRRDNCWFGQS